MSIFIEKNEKSRWLAGIVTAAALLSSQARAGNIDLGDESYRVPIVSWKAARDSRVVMQQHDFSCGSAAVATLLTFSYEQPIDEQTAFRQMYAAGDQTVIQKVGFSLLDMRQYLITRGFVADGFKGDLDAVSRIGVPVITLITTGNYHHFVVLRGIQGNEVLIADPSRGLRAVSRASFEKMWTGVLLLIRNNADIGGRHFNDPVDRKVLPTAALARGMDQQRASLSDVFLNLPLANEF